MSKIVFTDKNHSYNKGKKRYTSVTGLVGMFEPKMDVEYWSKYKALEELIPEFSKIKSSFKGSKDPNFISFCECLVKPEVLLKKQLEIKAGWRETNKKAIQKGNKYHLAREKKSILTGKETNPFTNKEVSVHSRPKSEFDNYSLKQNLFELEDGYYPELLIWNEKYELAGQSDRVFIETIKGIRYVDIDDYKTNNKITTENKYENLLDPLGHIPNTKFHRYELQVSLYAWMMEQFGFVVRNTAFTHFNKVYETEYRKTEVNDMLAVLANKKTIQKRTKKSKPALNK